MEGRRTASFGGIFPPVLMAVAKRRGVSWCKHSNFFLSVAFFDFFLLFVGVVVLGHPIAENRKKVCNCKFCGDCF